MKFLVLALLALFAAAVAALPLRTARVNDAAAPMSMLLVNSRVRERATVSKGGVTKGGTASDKETCVGCKFVWYKVDSMTDATSGYEEVRAAFEKSCQYMPEVFYDACDDMFDQLDEMVTDFLNDVGMDDMCINAGLCWMGLLSELGV
eukprot:PLAT13424.1.p2 GENE.PLAT13424.1~~PLAT13424.1.p2  ORF type:complete len:159 (-),score=41.42 PLAT13424.1:94-537(-)